MTNFGEHRHRPILVNTGLFPYHGAVLSDLPQTVPIKVFLITDHCLLARALEQFIGSAPQRFAVVGSGSHDEAAIGRAAAQGADIVVLDLDGHEERALPLLARLRERSKAKVLLLTRQDNSALQDKAVMAGARGVLDRQTTPESLLTALEKVHEGQLWLDRAATGRIFVEFSRLGGQGTKIDDAGGKLNQLTEREHEIVAFIARNDGESGKVIASKLHISESTLRNHLTSIYEKLGVANRPGLLAYAYQHGLAEPPQKQAS